MARLGSHCRRGHALDAGNTYVRPGDGARTCLICKSFREKCYRAGVKMPPLTHCRQGHLLGADNSVEMPGGWVRCLDCKSMLPFTHCKKGHELTDENTYLYGEENYTVQQCRTCARARDRGRNGISAEEYERLLESQGGKCAACGRDAEVTAKRDRRGFAADHDHRCCPTLRGSCGKCIRGLLCASCNRGIGYFYDDPVRLEQAASYLRRSRPALIALSGSVGA